MFNHVPVDIPEVSTKTVNRKRFYVTPTGLYPSITTVLGVRKAKQKGLQEWRNRVGNDVANHIMRTAASRGTAVHHMCEDFLNNIEVTQEGRDFLPWCLFSQLKPTLESSINKIYAQECGLWSEKYRVAGRVDCIAEFDGRLSIIDFKTSSRPKQAEYITNYFQQGSAYAVMYEERTGIPIDTVVIIMAVEGNEPQLFIEKRDNYIESYREVRNEYQKVMGI